MFEFSLSFFERFFSLHLLFLHRPAAPSPPPQTQGEISAVRACFGKMRGSVSGQVAENGEFPITFFAISWCQGFPVKLA